MPGQTKIEKAFNCLCLGKLAKSCAHQQALRTPKQPGSWGRQWKRRRRKMMKMKDKHFQSLKDELRREYMQLSTKRGKVIYTS